jgi:hypothetical protein
MYKPYVIISPPWETTSGGVRVMFGLYGWLLAKGQVAFMNEQPVDKYGAPLKDIVVIYPEIQAGNPLNANTVVRYILNKPGEVPAVYSDGTVKSGPTEFDPTDNLIYFSRLYGGDDKNTMFLPICNLHLFRDQGKKRTKTSFMLGKGIKEPGILSKQCHPKDAIEITREFAQDQQALADLLNECQVLYNYDPVSAITEIARLCGTRVIQIPTKYTKEEFSVYEPGLNGISWATEENEPLNVEAFREHYKEMTKTFEKRLEDFINETQR